MSEEHAVPAARLRTRGLHLAYGDASIIEDMNLCFPDAQVTAIVGPNGCGKSTLLAGLARLHAPRGGAVLLDGKDIHRLPTREVARRVALLPQDTQAPEGMTVSELIRFGRQPHQGWLRQWSDEDRDIVAHALAVADLQQLAQRSLDSMSGGQRQRAWIAMAIAQQTPLLLLDEPTSALDLGHQLEVFELIRRQAHTGTTVIMVVHDLASACRFADNLVAMHAGRVIAQGPPDRIITPELIRELYGVECTLLADPVTGTPILAGVRRA
ncbi:ABC transporter ATP-binding protein [Pseudomonas profundi]|uniref:ABC transporter ATP-binding protein n=1 Tax=Pseudomonas profundi TaxID=1981513 RepID=UPI001238C3E9|nr:ABC transporter ATP-binding protein [Pseudomonas profundi]